MKDILRALFAMFGVSSIVYILYGLASLSEYEHMFYKPHYVVVAVILAVVFSFYVGCDLTSYSADAKINRRLKELEDEKQKLILFIRLAKILVKEDAESLANKYIDDLKKAVT